MGRKAGVMRSTFWLPPFGAQTRGGHRTMITLEVGNLGAGIQSHEQRWDVEEAQREYRFPRMKDV